MSYHLPEDFTSRMKLMLEGEYDSFLESYDKPQYKALRFNSLKGDLSPALFQSIPSAESSAPLERVGWAVDGYYYPDSLQPGKHPYHEMGLYYIQEPSAMAPAAYLDSQPGEHILDLCAAPGGKSTQIAAAMKQQGILISNEIHPARAKILSENIERMGIINAIVTNETPQNLAVLFGGYFDRIIVDAPCSGEGMFRKNDEACGQWSPANVQLCADRQDEILDCADEMLRAGGRMVYSTCTFAPLENEGSIGRFLLRHPDYEVLPVPLYEGMSHGNPGWTGLEGSLPAAQLSSLSHTIRLWPHKLNGEGHFVAVLQKKGTGAPAFQPMSRFGLAEGVPIIDCQIAGADATAAKVRKKAHTDHDRTYRSRDRVQTGKPDLTPLAEFLTTNIKVPLNGTLQFFGDQIYLLPEGAPALTRLRTIRAGLHLGSMNRDRFEPSLSLALYVSPAQVRNYVNLTSVVDYRTALNYLNGLTFPWEGEKGWYLICLGGYSLGWGKLAGGIMKNHYPKGKRKLLQ